MAAGADASGRLAGADRFATAAAVSRSHFTGGADVVFVVTGQSFPDALTAGPAAAHRGGPVLLVNRSSVPTSTRDELTRLDPDAIVLVGGEGAVSSSVESELRRVAPVTRVSGSDRYSTAVAASRATFASASTVYVAGGARFSDALAGAPAAHAESAPMLLVTSSSVPPSTADEIRRLGAKRAVILGGTASVDGSVESQLRSLVGDVVRVAGNDRYTTSTKASARAFSDVSTVYLASGATYADALAGGAVAALQRAPILLVRANCIPQAIRWELGRLSPSRVVLLGGSATLGSGVERLITCPYAGAPPKAPSVSPAASPAWDDDGPDPDLMRVGSTWYVYTTGTTWGNRIGVLTSDRPDGGWRTTTGRSFGSTALPSIPSWQVQDTQWAPGVMAYRGRYVMFYAAQVKGVGKWCISVAVSSSPTGPFSDSSSGPLVCQLDIGGSIDPMPFVDADGKAWLHWKNNDGSTADVSKVWAAPLTADGTGIAGAVREVMAKNTQAYPWQSTVDNPHMVIAEGLHFLFYSSGDYLGSSYKVGYAICATPVGPCTSGSQPILSSYGSAAGPAGGNVEVDASGRWWISYHAYRASECCSGDRVLYVAPLVFR